MYFTGPRSASGKNAKGNTYQSYQYHLVKSVIFRDQLEYRVTAISQEPLLLGVCGRINREMATEKWQQ